MIKKLAALTTTGLVAASLLVVTATAAEASTNSNTEHGITVRTAHNATAYNGKKVTIKPSIAVRSGVHEALVSHKVTAYKGSHKVTSGRSVHLHSGTYKVTVKVRYRVYELVGRARKYVGGVHSFTTPKRKVIVKNGGNVRLYRGHKSYTTPYTKLPRGAHAAYAWLSGSNASCSFVIKAHLKGGSTQTLSDTVGGLHVKTKVFKTNFAANVRFLISTNCAWALDLTWH
jgi:plastocyanin